ncbi:MAG: BlaI/MecI/CopY family transcriptional regulator [Oscillospiraceae bacterium]|nr:BlaI/MecI/CopY family transcriptional regulator [Oscillospiraceae bacterium]
MNDLNLGAVETRFAELIWANAPIRSGELVALCQKGAGLKKPTTYTVLRKLCEKGLFVNDGGTVRTLVTQEEFRAEKGEKFVAEAYGGSLPAFIAAVYQYQAP